MRPIRQPTGRHGCTRRDRPGRIRRKASSHLAGLGLRLRADRRLFTRQTGKVETQPTPSCLRMRTMPVATSIVMDVVSFAWSRAVSLRVGALKHTMISRVPFPNCRSGVIGLAIAGNPENDGRQSPWQEAVVHEIIPDTRRPPRRQRIVGKRRAAAADSFRYRQPLNCHSRGVSLEVRHPLGGRVRDCHCKELAMPDLDLIKQGEQGSS